MLSLRRDKKGITISYLLCPYQGDGVTLEEIDAPGPIA